MVKKKCLEIKKEHVVKEFLGLLAGWTRPSNDIKREMKNGWK